MTAAEIDLPTTAAKPEFHLPDDFVHPEPPQELVDTLHDAIGDLITEYLPPEWAEALGTYAITYAYHEGKSHDSMGDYEYWLKDFSRLKSFLAGLRYDKTDHFSEWVGPAPKLGKAARE